MRSQSESIFVLMVLCSVIIMVVAVAGCSSDADKTEQPAVTGTPHLLEPTAQMIQLAEQQCVDDPTKAKGEINAVDPKDPDRVLASVVVDCAEVRARR